MGRRHRAAPAALILWLLADGGSVRAGSSVELYRRAVPLEATTGVILIHETVARQVDVPVICDDGELDCRATRRFARIWRIDFEAETRTRAGDETLVEYNPRGTIHLALAGDSSDEEAYSADLRGALSRLGAAAFDEPFAGLRADREPFGGAVARRAAEPSWACIDDGAKRSATHYSREVSVADDGTELVTGSSTRTYSGNEIADTVCSALAEATTENPDESIRTMATPRLLLEAVLSVDVFDLLQPRAYADELAALPEGTWHRRRKVPGVGRSAGISNHNHIVESRLAVEEVETSARILAAELPPAAARANAWHARWTLETTERSLGPLPQARLVDSWTLTASLLPTLPPTENDPIEEGMPVRLDAGDPFPVRLDAEELLASVAHALDFRAEMSAEILARAIVRKIAGLKTAGWILVLCRTDAPATWGLAPTEGRAPVLNGKAFCDAVADQVSG